MAAPVTSIINSSLHQGIVPDQCKIFGITPVPKLFPPKHVKSDVRPIAVTNAIAVSTQNIYRHVVSTQSRTTTPLIWSLGSWGDVVPKLGSIRRVLGGV